MLGLMVEVLIAVDGSTLGSLAGPAILDRKSTRLNSSHLVISYAVFCLKKKKIALIRTLMRDDQPLFDQCHVYVARGLCNPEPTVSLRYYAFSQFRSSDLSTCTVVSRPP